MKIEPLNLTGPDPVQVEWTDALGGFFRNCGIIEFIAMEFIGKMATGFKYKSIKKKYLSQKITFIIEHLGEQTEAPQDQIEAVMETLEEIRQLSFFRNVLSHGAIGLANSGNEEGKSNSIIGILNYRPDDPDQDAEIISLAEIISRKQESADLAEKLLSHLQGLSFTGKQV